MRPPQEITYRTAGKTTVKNNGMTNRQGSDGATDSRPTYNNGGRANDRPTANSANLLDGKNRINPFAV